MTSAVVEVEDLVKVYRAGGVLSRRGASQPAVDGVSFRLEMGEFAALVGESGSGKTTLGRCLLGLLPFEGGSVRVAGFDVAGLRRAEQKAFRRAAQIIFQNPYASLNPALKVRSILAEAVRVHGGGGGVPPEELERLAHLVRLPPERLEERPPSLSGGEKRRVAFARALATRPQFIVTDEPVSGLDLPIQVQLLELLRRIHARRQITFLFISHDLRVVRFLATRVLVLYRGRLVEDALAETFFGGGALHPYSRELLESAFEPEKVFQQRGGAPGPKKSEPEGCAFRQRCRDAGVDREGPCATMTPRVEAVEREHRVACHRWNAPRE